MAGGAGETPSTAVAATPANKEKPTRSGTLIIVREVLSRLPPNHGDPLLQRLVTYNSQGWLEPGATKVFSCALLTCPVAWWG